MKIKLLSLALGLILILAISAWAASEPQPRVITVSGDADVKVVPDEVVLTVGVETRDKDLTVVKQQNDERVQKVLALAKEYKIESKYVQTEYINIAPDYDNNHNFREYIARKSIVFILKDVSKFESLLTSALNSGANYVHGVQFRTTELRKYRDQARALAIKAARGKAVDLAKELEQKIGKPRSIQEGYNSWYSPYNAGWWGSYGYGGMSQNAFVNVGGTSSESESTIALGQITVTAHITVTFDLQ